MLAADDAAPDPPPPSWRALPPPPFAPYEDAAPGALPLRLGGLAVEEAPEGTVLVALDDGGGGAARVPRYWLARMLFRAALHGLRLGYVETYGGLFLDDGGGDAPAVELGLRTASGKASIAIPRGEALAAVERLYRAVAPAGYRERLR